MSFRIQITIPEYITEVRTSKSRRKKYFKKGNKLPKKYRTKYFGYDNQGLLRELVSGTLVIANPRTAGKPKTEKLSGNSFASGYLNPAFRARLVREIKDSFRPHIREQVKDPFPADAFPLRVAWQVYTTVNVPSFDLSNFWFYYKYFEDCLFEKTHPKTKKKLNALIPDDSVRYITQAPSPQLIPVDNWEDRKFVFTFASDERECIKQHPLWI